MIKKAIGVLLVLLILLTAGCTTAPSGTAPSLPSTPTVAPSSSPETVTALPPASSPSDASEQTPASTHKPEVTPTPEPAPPENKDAVIQFIWTSDTGVRLEDATVPGICRLEDGRFRLYYGGPGGILSAISEDGLSFTRETGVRIPYGSPGGPEMIVSDPAMVRLKDGRVRMYYKGATGPGGPGQSVHRIFSAVATDGLSFEKDGVSIDSPQTPDRGWASVPEAIVLPDGRVRLYYVSDGLDVKHGIVSAISEDGLSFNREGPLLTGFVDPAIIRLDDGSYLMLAVAFPSGSGSKLTDATPGIYSFISQDGISFDDRKLVLAGEGNIDPAIVDTGDGAYRVYYWNIADNPPVIKSMSGKLASASSAQPAAPPAITPVFAPRSITGAKVWLFAIDDGNPRLAASAESDGKLLMGRLEITGPDTAVSWQTVASPSATGGLSIADHWHIFAHGYHWLVFSVAGDSASYLLKLDTNFQRLALVPVEHSDGPTNDMFLVAEPDGVAVGHFKPGYGHTIYRFDMQAKKTGQVLLGGGMFTHTNGSSAIPVEGGYLLFATESLNPSATSAVRLIRFDPSWQPINIRAVLDENGTNAAMTSAVRLESGYVILHSRVRTGVSSRQKAPAAPQPGSQLPDDSGALVRLVLAPDGAIVSRETLVSSGVNRPHTTLANDLLITTWDENDTSYLRIDRIQ